MQQRNSLRVASQILLVLGLGILFGACQNSSEAEKPEQEEKKIKVVPIDTVLLEATDFVEFREYYGKVSGIAEATLITAIGGHVEAIGADIGDSVTAGQSLGEIDAQKTKMGFEVAELNEKIARENYERAETLFKGGNTSRLSVDEKHLAWLNSKNSLIDAKRADESARCISPIAGVVVSRFIELHQEMLPGSPTFSIAQIGQLKITIGIPEMDMAGIRIGTQAEVTFSMHPGLVRKGRLKRLARQVSPGTLTFMAEIHISNPNLLVLPGVTALVKLVRKTHADKIVVPTESILAGSDGTYVMIEQDGLAHKLSVLTGPSSATHTVILDGLDEGSQLIVGGNHLVSEGTQVTVKQRG